MANLLSRKLAYGLMLPSLSFVPLTAAGGPQASAGILVIDPLSLSVCESELL